MDYIFPQKIADAMKKPSLRTQLESSMIGIVVMILSSLCVFFYIAIYSAYSIKLKIFIGFGELGIILMMLSQLVSTFQQYFSHKLMLGLYKEQKKELEVPVSIELNANEEVKNGK